MQNVTIATLYIGIEKTGDGRTITPAEVRPAIEVHLKAIAVRFGGYTLTDGRGGWRDDHGRLVEERCLVLTVIAIGEGVRDSMAIYANRIAGALDQTCVMLTCCDAVSQVVTA